MRVFAQSICSVSSVWLCSGCVSLQTRMLMQVALTSASSPPHWCIYILIQNVEHDIILYCSLQFSLSSADSKLDIGILNKLNKLKKLLQLSSVGESVKDILYSCVCNHTLYSCTSEFMASLRKQVYLCETVSIVCVEFVRGNCSSGVSIGSVSVPPVQRVDLCVIG